jgi:hypothetical protein
VAEAAPRRKTTSGDRDGLFLEVAMPAEGEIMLLLVIAS